MKINKTFIGIDPDVTKSGVAYKNGKDVILKNLHNSKWYQIILLKKIHTLTEGVRCNLGGNDLLWCCNCECIIGLPLSIPDCRMTSVFV